MARGQYGSHFEKDGFVAYYSGSDSLAKPVRADFGQDVLGLRIQRPGSYFAWALDVSPLKLPPIEVLRGLLADSVSVQIEEGGTATADLRTTRVPN